MPTIVRAQKVVTDHAIEDSVLQMISGLKSNNSLRDTDIIVIPIEPSVAAKQILGIELQDDIDETKKESFLSDSVKANGYISQTVTNGNNKNLSQNTLTDLKVSTTFGNDIKISAQIQDANMPVDNDGSTNQISELSSAVLSLQKDSTIFSAGDIMISQNNSQLFNFQKKIKGFDIVSVNNLNSKQDTLSVKADFAVTKGKFRRQEFTGTDNSQGPYYLSDNLGNTVIVLIGTESVYLDGNLLTRGADMDYEIDYNLGTIEFNIKHVITSQSSIVVDFEYQESFYNNYFLYAEAGIKRKKSNFKIGYMSEFDAVGSAEQLSDSEILKMQESDYDVSEVNIGDTIVACPYRKDFLLLNAGFDCFHAFDLDIENVLCQDVKNKLSLNKKSDKSFASSVTAYRNFYNSDSTTNFSISLNTKFFSENFVPLLTDKSVDFLDLWNLESYESGHQEAFTTLEMNFRKKSFSTNAKFLTADISEVMNGKGVEFSLGNSKTRYNYGINTLYYQDIQTDKEFKHSDIDVFGELNFKPFVLGFDFLQSQNYLGGEVDSANLNYRDFCFYINNSDSSNLNWKISVNNRQTFIDFAMKDNFGSSKYVSAELSTKKSDIYKFKFLEILKKTDNNGENFTSLTGRLENRLLLWKKQLIISANQESGCGTQEQMSYKFIKTSAGNGYFVWNDYNGDGVEDLNEFEKSFYKTDADYVKYFLHTGKYFNTIVNKINFDVRFKGKLSDTKFSKISSRFDLSAFYDIQTKGSLKSGNAFFYGDSLIQKSLNQNYKSKLMLTKFLWAGDNFSKSESQRLTFYGNEVNETKSNEIFVETSFLNFFVTEKYILKHTNYFSEFFSDKNYQIQAKVYHTEIKYNFDFGLSPGMAYINQTKENINDSLLIKLYSLEFYLNFVSEQKGAVSMNFKFVNNPDCHVESGSVLYQMLEGLSVGRNFVFNLNTSYMLTKHLQLNLCYEMRKSQTSKPLHVGSMELKMVF